MKMRIGLVTNSSNVSFCIAGNKFEIEELLTDAMIEFIKNIDAEDFPSWTTREEICSGKSFQAAFSIIENELKCKFKNLYVKSTNSGYHVYAGIRLDKHMQENETLKDFCKRAHHLLNKTPFPSQHAKIWIDGWYDG